MLRCVGAGQAASTPKHSERESPKKATFGAGSVPDPAVLVLDPVVLLPDPERSTMGRDTFCSFVCDCFLWLILFLCECLYFIVIVVLGIILVGGVGQTILHLLGDMHAF